MPTEIDELDLVSTVWILASNDENSIITYEGVRHRLGLSPGYDVKGIIQKRGELFRRGANPTQLETWKADMLAGRRLPSWIRAEPEGEKRQKVIDDLSTDDVCRSQFRAAKDAERSPIEIIKWGLEHVDRLRKSRQEERQASATSLQMWLVAAVGIASLLAQFAVAWLKDWK